MQISWRNEFRQREQKEKKFCGKSVLGKFEE